MRFDTDRLHEKTGAPQDVVGAAVASWREAESRLPAERLSEGARANIRVLARHTSDAPADRELERPLARLFPPVGRIAAVAAVPALILAFSFGWMLGGGGQALGPAADFVAIETSKIDGEAVFDIANGGQVHRVYKSTSAKDLAQADLFATVEGGFSDTLTGDETIVFYRID